MRQGSSYRVGSTRTVGFRGLDLGVELVVSYVDGAANHMVVATFHREGDPEAREYTLQWQDNDGRLGHYDCGLYGPSLDDHAALIADLRARLHDRGGDEDWFYGESYRDLMGTIGVAVEALLRLALPSYVDEIRTPDGLVGWREVMGWSQSEAAAALGCGRRSLQMWESGRNAIPYYIALAAAALTAGAPAERREAGDGETGEAGEADGDGIEED